MYYSRITLDLAKLPPGRLKELITKGSYALHQWVWLLFTDDETRQFLFREEEGQGFLRFYVLSENAPTKNDLFQIETTGRLSMAEAILSFSIVLNHSKVNGAGAKHRSAKEAFVFR